MEALPQLEDGRRWGNGTWEEVKQGVVLRRTIVLQKANFKH
jgi:hypothetical protein